MKAKVALLFLSLTALVGCSEKDEVVSYRVPKEESKAVVPQMPPPSQMSANAMPGLAQQTQGFVTPDWEVPSSWAKQPAGAMRKGSFLAKSDDGQAEITVLAFPGNVGGTLANVNRWAGQIGLPALQPGSEKNFEKMEVSGEAGDLVKLVSPEKMILAVIVERAEGSWFFKMMGDKAVVEAEEARFLEFIESVKFKN